MLLVNKVKTKRTSSPVRVGLSAEGREGAKPGWEEGECDGRKGKERNGEKAAAGLGRGEARKAFIPCHQIGRNETKSESS